MITFTANLHLLTPAFLGGANHEAQAIRLTALKSALRWWWRALQWAHVAATNTDAAAARATLWSREMALFGSASDIDGNKECGGQGAFLMRLVSSECETWDSQQMSGWTAKKRVGLAYLLGQGLWEGKDFAPNRSALCPGNFTVEFLFRPVKNQRSSEQVKTDIEQISQALWLLCHFGGIGARARRGWGSLMLSNVPVLAGFAHGAQLLAPAKNTQQCAAQLAALLPQASAQTVAERLAFPPFTAFSGHSQVVCVADYVATCDQALERVGGNFQAFRKGMGEADMVLVNGFVRADGSGRGLPTRAPARAVFGLAHNYFIKGKQRQPEVSVTIAPSTSSDRRASPLLIHMHQWPGAKPGDFSAVYSLLPAAFLPDGETLQYATGRRTHEVAVSAAADLWQPANTFMTEMKRWQNAHTILSAVVQPGEKP